MEQFQVTGLWWLPSKPTETFSGVLTFLPEVGFSLEIVGNIGGITGLQSDFQAEFLHGIGEKKIVTLHDVYCTSTSISTPGGVLQKLSAKRAFVGAHITNIDFKEVDIELDYLPEFVNKTSLTKTIGYDDKNHWTGLKAEVVSQKPISLGEIEGGKAYVNFSWGNNEERFRSITLKEKCYVTIKLKSELNYSDIISKYVRPIQDLVTMATDRPNNLSGIRFKGISYIDEYTKKMASIEMYERSTSEIDLKKDKTLLRPYMLFTLNDLKKDQLSKWLKTTDQFGPVVGILFGQRYSKSIHIENRLLNSVSAAEAFHRRRFTNTVLKKAEWKEKKKRIIQSVGEDDEQFVKDILQFSNEKRLKTRLDEILDYSGLDNSFVVDAKAWNTKIRSYRNVLTHYDPDAPQKIDNYELLYWLADSLAWVVLASLMVEMGFDQTEVNQLLAENQRFIFAKATLQQLLT